MKKHNQLLLQHIRNLVQPFYDSKNTKYPTLDRHVSTYFRTHKSLGSNERRRIYDKVYDLIRYHHYLNYLCKGSTDLEMRLNLLHSSDFYNQLENNKLSKWTRCSFPKNLYELIEQSCKSEHEAFELCKAFNTRAPLTVRINPAKTTRADFMKKIGKYLNIEFVKCEFSPYGIKVPNNKNVDLYGTEQFKEGHFEVQDEASQIAALQVQCRPGDLVLDFCSGSGGKSLAISHLLEGKGQIYLHDPRESTLLNAKKRFHRAGVTNVQFHSDESSLSKIIKNKADWIILDVPCTGTGTIRRNPDIKFRFSPQGLNENILLQQRIVHNSLKYLGRNGKIVYMTCSALQEENEEQVKHFTKEFGLQIRNGQYLKTTTAKNGMDTMFAVVLQKKSKQKSNQK